MKKMLRRIPSFAWADDVTDTPIGFVVGITVAIVLWVSLFILVVL